MQVLNKSIVNVKFVVGETAIMTDNDKIVYIGHWYTDDHKITGVVIQQVSETGMYNVWFTDGEPNDSFPVYGGTEKTVEEAKFIAERILGHKVEWQKMLL